MKQSRDPFKQIVIKFYNFLRGKKCSRTISLAKRSHFALPERPTNSRVISGHWDLRWGRVMCVVVEGIKFNLPAAEHQRPPTGVKLSPEGRRFLFDCHQRQRRHRKNTIWRLISIRLKGGGEEFQSEICIISRRKSFIGCQSFFF